MPAGIRARISLAPPPSRAVTVAWVRVSAESVPGDVLGVETLPDGQGIARFGDYRCRVVTDADRIAVVDWAGLEGEIFFTERFQSENGLGGYFSRVSVAEEGNRATELPGTFWLDEKGLRHFVAELQPGQLGMLGGAAGSA